MSICVAVRGAQSPARRRVFRGGLTMKQIKTILQNNGAGTERVSATTMPQAQPADAPQDTKPAKADYNGTPYSLIVEALLARWGIFG